MAITRIEPTEFKYKLNFEVTEKELLLLTGLLGMTNGELLNEMWAELDAVRDGIKDGEDRSHSLVKAYI